MANSDESLDEKLCIKDGQEGLDKGVQGYDSFITINFEHCK